MQAIVLESATAGSAVRREVRSPEVGPEDVLCEPLAVGLCHTDVSVIRGYSAVQAGYAPTYPLVIGHEFVALVREVGSKVTAVSPGDRVVTGSHISCRDCRWCNRGRAELCSSKKVIGLDVNGALAELISVPAILVRHIDDDVPLELAVLAEPFAVGLHAVQMAKIGPHDKVAVIGPGAVGLLTLGALVAEGHETTVIGLAADAQQLRLAKKLGAAVALTVDDALTHVAGEFDVVIETAGHHAAVEAALSLIGAGGRVVCVGLPQESTSVDTADLARQEKVLIGSRAYDLSTWDRVPELLTALPQLSQLVTHKLSMDDIEQAVRLTEDGVATKVMLVPQHVRTLFDVPKSNYSMERGRDGF